MGTLTLRRPPKIHVDRAPHDPRTDVKLAGDWLERWLPELDQGELRAYLQLAHLYNTRTYHDPEMLARIVGGPDPEELLSRLEARGLVEVIAKGSLLHFHFPHRDSDGYHRGSPARPSLAEALAFQEAMSEQLLTLSEADETPELREEVFAAYPELAKEYRLYQETADEATPRWRLWMEVSNLLIRTFEDAYGSLRSDHGALFKEVNAKVLGHHLALVDGVVDEVVARLEDLFPEVHDEWVVAPSEERFSSLPFVRQQAERYRLGAEQIFLNVVERLGLQGRVVVFLDAEGFLGDLVLPSTTGLTKSEERVLFLRPEDRRQDDSPRNRERVRRARNKYANYLIERACAVLADFVNAERVRSIDAWLERIAEKVNDALDLLHAGNGERVVRLDTVIDRFDRVRQGVRSFPFEAPSPLPEEEESLPRATARLPRGRVRAVRVGPRPRRRPRLPATSKKKATKKKAAKKKAAKKKATKKKAAKKKAAKKKAKRRR